MKVLAIGDPHFRTDNIQEVVLFLEKIEDLAKTQEPDLIVILGDVLHTHERLHTTPLNYALSFFDKMRQIAPTVILVGNHDMLNNQAFLASESHWMNAMKEWDNVTIADKVVHKTLGGYHFVFVPYVPPGRFIEALNMGEEGVSTPEDDTSEPPTPSPVQEQPRRGGGSPNGECSVQERPTPVRGWSSATCIFAHQEFYGCKMGAIISVEGDRWSPDYPPVISGHIHSKQTLDNVYYCGSAMQNAFGESEENIIPILTWEDPEEPYKLEEIDLGLPRKKIVYTDVESIEDLKIPETDDKVKITISGVYDEFKAFKKTKKYKELIKSGKKVVFKPKKIAKTEDDVPAVDETDFAKILSFLVEKEKNPFLHQLHELIVNNREIAEDDVLYV